MTGTLIESRTPAQRHNLGSVVSIVVHGALITSAVLATAGKSRMITTALPDPVFPLQLPAPVPREPAASAPSTPNSMAVVPDLPAIRAPLVIPATIPAVDFTAAPAVADFTGRGPRAVSQCVFPCAGTSADSASPVWSATAVIMQLREPPVPPRYPEALRRAGVDGTVVVKFVVDTLGRVDMSTVEVLSSSHDLFTAAVRETLARLRFNPARAGEQRVRAAATMPFHFTLR